MSRDNNTWIHDLQCLGIKQQEALSELRDVLFRGLRRVLASRPAADDAFVEDVVQEALLRILDRLEQFEGRSQFLTWATSIAIRVALSELRRRRWQDVSLEDLVADADFSQAYVPAMEPGPVENWEQGTLLETMHWVIQNQLTEKQRKALVAELRGMPLDEIAGQLGSNRNAIYKLTHDARKRPQAGTRKRRLRGGGCANYLGNVRYPFMALSKDEVEALMRLVSLTQDDELNCEQCMALVAEFAERRLAGKSIPDSLRLLEQHLLVCPECREEFEALEQALKEMEG